MIPSAIERGHVIEAMQEIDSDGVPSSRCSKKFLIEFEGRQYPPKYVVSLANKFANGEELDPSVFNGGQETNDFLKGLGFTIVASSEPEPIPPVEPLQNRHNERCPDCKNVVERMLKKIYGDVKPNYRFNIGTNPENFRDTPHYEDLKRIFTNLQNYRGNKNFVYTPTLPNCDYFVPDPGFVVEFDESQHFTIPRKISLLSYPYKSESGFSLGRWAFICDKTRAKDNHPYYRDEQRAWYDTLRDFLPELTGNFKPTVRIYSKGIQWCSLDPNDPDDVARFKNIIEGRRKDLNGWVATVVLQSDSDTDYSNDDRMKELISIVDRIAKETSGDGVILFPGGWFCTKKEKPSTIYDWVESQIKGILEKIKPHIFVCIGIDGSTEAECGNTQIGLAVDKGGIKAMGRKFHPAPQERGHVELAPNYLSEEDGESRIFELNGVKYFMCVCYDTYGIRHLDPPNPGVDVVLNLVHCFYPQGEGPSGDPYFARHGFAGASKQWGCPVFGTAAFFNRSISDNWPTGVYWNQDDKSTRNWSYAYNPVKSEVEFRMSTENHIKEGLALIRIYDLETMCKR
nr:conserved hypothetical protein [uncultured archaeon GZfos31B6]